MLSLFLLLLSAVWHSFSLWDQPFWNQWPNCASHHSCWLYGGDTAKKLWGRCSQVAPHRNFVVNFWNSKMSQFIAFVVHSQIYSKITSVSLYKWQKVHALISAWKCTESFWQHGFTRIRWRSLQRSPRLP